MATFQDRFNVLFEESDLSQEDFGKLFGASKGQVFNWRSGRGEPDSETLKLIAAKCNVSVEWLIGNINIRTPIVTLAANRDDNKMDDLPDSAIREIENFKEFIRNKYKQK